MSFCMLRLNFLTWPPSTPQQSKAFHPKQQEKNKTKQFLIYYQTCSKFAFIVAGELSSPALTEVNPNPLCIICASNQILQEDEPLRDGWTERGDVVGCGRRLLYRSRVYEMCSCACLAVRKVTASRGPASLSEFKHWCVCGRAFHSHRQHCARIWLLRR